MTDQRRDFWLVADRIQMNLRYATNGMVELRGMLSQFDIPDEPKPTCPTCSIRVAGPKSLVEHMENVHGQYESERPRA